MKSLDVLRALDTRSTAVVEAWIYGALDDVATLTEDIGILRQEMGSLATTMMQVELACSDISDLRAALRQLNVVQNVRSFENRSEQ